jgi:hypothetical protein
LAPLKAGGAFFSKKISTMRSEIHELFSNAVEERLKKIIGGKIFMPISVGPYFDSFRISDEFIKLVSVKTDVKEIVFHKNVEYSISAIAIFRKSGKAEPLKLVIRKFTCTDFPGKHKIAEHLNYLHHIEICNFFCIRGFVSETLAVVC